MQVQHNHMNSSTLYSVILLDVGLKDNWKIRDGRSLLLNFEPSILGTLSSQFLKTSKDRDCLAFLGELFHCLAVRMVRIVFLHLGWNFVISIYVDVILPAPTSVKAPSWYPPCRSGIHVLPKAISSPGWTTLVTSAIVRWIFMNSHDILVQEPVESILFCIIWARG